MQLCRSFRYTSLADLSYPAYDDHRHPLAYFCNAVLLFFAALAFFLLALQKHIAPLLLIISTVFAFIAQVILMRHALFSLVVVLLLLYHVVVVVILYVEQIPKRLKLKAQLLREEEENWRDKI